MNSGLFVLCIYLAEPSDITTANLDVFIPSIEISTNARDFAKETFIYQQMFEPPPEF